MEKELVGFDITDQSVKLEGQDIIGAVAAKHVGKMGWLKVTVEGGFQFIPLVNKGIDKLEEIIPGDQSAVAAMLKTAVSNIKIKF